MQVLLEAEPQEALPGETRMSPTRPEEHGRAAHDQSNGFVQLETETEKAQLQKPTTCGTHCLSESGFNKGGLVLPVSEGHAGLPEAGGALSPGWAPP